MAKLETATSNLYDDMADWDECEWCEVHLCENCGGDDEDNVCCSKCYAKSLDEDED